MAKLLLWFLFTFAASVWGQEACLKPPKDPEESKCCEEVKWEDIDVIQQCEKTWVDKHFCATDCVFNATNVMMNGQIKSENMKALLEKALKKDPLYIPIVIKAFEECYPMVKEKMGGKNLQMEGCNALPGIATDCMFAKMFINCPAEKWKNNKDCTDLKAYFTKCPIHLPPGAKV